MNQRMKSMLSEEPYVETPVSFRARIHKAHLKDTKRQAQTKRDRANWQRKQDELND